MRISALFVVAFAASGCMTIYGSAVHRVDVTSTPSDARVFVDGQPVGATPVRVTVSSADPDPVITVEKDGYPTYRRRLQRSVSVWRTLGSVGIGAGLGLVATIGLAVAREASFGGSALIPLAAAGLLPVTDWQSGALFKFPDRVDARLASPPPGRPWSPERRRQERERWRRDPGGPRPGPNRPPARHSAESFEPLPAVGPVQPLGDAPPPDDLCGRAILDVGSARRSAGAECWTGHRLRGSRVRR